MKTWMGEPVLYATHKYDGYGMILAKNTIGESSLRSSKHVWWPVWCDWYKNFIRLAPNNTKLHVEVFVKRGVATDVIHNLTRSLSLSMRVTGIETWFHTNKTLISLVEVDDLCMTLGLEAAMWNRWCRHIDYADLALHLKIEGFVLKSHSYVPSEMYKVKPVLTADLYISGFVDGKGKYLGLVGAIVCEDGSGKEVCKVSGMTDAIRINLEHEDIGRVVEVEYQSVTNRGKLHHPRFKRFRDGRKVVDVI